MIKLAAHIKAVVMIDNPAYNLKTLPNLTQ